MSRVARYMLVVGAMVSLAGLAPGCDDRALDVAAMALSEGGAASESPEQPAIMREVAPIQSGQFMAPTIPPMRTTADGRVALNIKRINNKVGFFLFSPERLDEPLMDSSPGVEILADTAPFGGGLQQRAFHASRTPGAAVTHLTLCDGTPESPSPGEATNPSPCGDAGADDCYNLTVMTVVDLVDNGVDINQIWGTPVTVRVAGPKTELAEIAAIDVGQPVLGPSWPINAFFEPMVTRDGRLLTGRVGNSTVTWTHPSGEVMTHQYDIMYSVAPVSSAACDVTAFTELLPLSHAPYDDDMVGRYGIAEYPFRDPQGRVIPDGADLQANYPWVDRDGDNLFMTTVQATLYYEDTTTGEVETRYPAGCVPGTACEAPATGDDIYGFEPSSDTRGVAMAGLWTHGKMVMLDTSINNTDFGLKSSDDYHRELSLYSAPSSGGSSPSPVRVGSGRDNSSVGSPLGSVHNTTFIDSTEHLFNHDPNLAPVTLRDVVWTLNTGRGSAEIAFDDYLSPHGFILSSMAGALSHSGAYDQAQMAYHDGFQRSGPSYGAGFTEDVLLQNAATSVTWEPPMHGLATGDVRLEPVALGGIEGKGMWLNGDAGVRYDVGAQPQDVSKTPWYVGVFVDSRFDDDTTTRRLMTWPDGSSVAMEGRGHILLRSQSGATVRRVNLPAPLMAPEAGWFHLGLVVNPGGTRVTVLVNGLRLMRHKVRPVAIQPVDSNNTGSTGGSAPAPSGLFQMVPGTFTLGAIAGDDEPGFRGWVDELKVFAERPTLEVQCNHARGTLVGLPDDYSGPWSVIADAYPPVSHKRVTYHLNQGGQQTFGRYVCAMDYTSDAGMTRVTLPVGTVGLREGLLMPEGPLVFGQPRPDSTQNVFCTSCHTPEQPSELSLDALTPLGGLALQDDERRQPMQAPRLIFGHIPAGYVGDAAPLTAQVADDLGAYLDLWMHAP
jgi:hypothetical protein